MRDALAGWLEVRGRVPWRELGTFYGEPAGGVRDGMAEHFRNLPDPVRSRRLMAALDLVEAAVAIGRPLTFAVLAGWQAVVLGGPAGFRTGPAFA